MAFIKEKDKVLCWWVFVNFKNIADSHHIFLRCATLNGLPPSSWWSLTKNPKMQFLVVAIRISGATMVREYHSESECFFYFSKLFGAAFVIVLRF